MISIENQQSILINIARELKEQITAFTIGGTAMMFQGLKNSTLDIDLVFTSSKDQEGFIQAARKIGWTYLDSKIIYGERKNIPIMLKLIDERLDLFLIEVIDFIFSDSMQKRAKITKQFERNLILKIADPHDIIIMKCATDRIKDIDDARTIIENIKIDWNILIEEAQKQINLGKERAILELGTFLERLQKIKVAIPKKILDELWLLLEKQIKQKRKH